MANLTLKFPLGQFTLGSEEGRGTQIVIPSVRDHDSNRGVRQQYNILRDVQPQLTSSPSPGPDSHEYQKDRHLNTFDYRL